jgi:hypothetical protein
MMNNVTVLLPQKYESRVVSDAMIFKLFSMKISDGNDVMKIKQCLISGHYCLI